MAKALEKVIDFDSKNNIYNAKTRQDALQNILSGNTDTAKHEHAVSPLVHNATSHIIKNHGNLDIELYGFPYEVLEQASLQLEKAGISSKIAKQEIAALEEYILNMGTDFSRAAKAKPLYVRFKVTDHKPDDLPDCEQSQATFLDGMKSYGGDSANIIRYLSLFGSKSTSSQGVDVDAMFVSKKKGLFVYFCAPSHEGIKGFDGADNALMNAMQGVGGALSDEAMTELKEMIQNGDLSPEALQLLESLAELSQLQEAMLTPNAIDNPEAKLADLIQEISGQITQAIESGAIPSNIISAAVNTLVDVAQTHQFSDIIDMTPLQDLLADNDNMNTLSELQELIEALAGLGSEDLFDLIQTLSKSDNLPPELQEILDQIDIDNLTPESLAEALSAQADNVLAQTIQSLIISLNNPELQSALSQELLDTVHQFLTDHSALNESITTHVVTQNLETALENIAPDTPEAVTIENIIEDLKTGTEKLYSIDPTIIQAVALETDSATFTVLDNTLTTIKNAASDSVVTTGKKTNLAPAAPPIPPAPAAPEQKTPADNIPSANDNDSPSPINPKNLLEPGKEPTPEPGKEPTPEPGKEPTPEPRKEPNPEPGKEPNPEPGKEPTPEPGKEPNPEPGKEPNPEPGKEPNPAAKEEKPSTPETPFPAEDNTGQKPQPFFKKSEDTKNKWTIPRADNDNTITDYSPDDLDDLVKAFETACNGDCVTCKKCIPENIAPGLHIN